MESLMELSQEDDCNMFPLEMLTPESKVRPSPRTAFPENEIVFGRRKFGKSLSFDDSRMPAFDRFTNTGYSDEQLSDSSAERIMNTLEEMSTNDSLIGDGTKVYTLPTVNGGKHKDLKYISHETLSGLMKNQYSDKIRNYVIIDCRYPYEYSGGHIKGSVNLHTQEMIDNFFTQDQQHTDHRNTVLIFHCEFSSERGPKLLRYLRNKDREVNAENYPILCYPEIYLLCGGYKEFFENQKDQCFPQSYVPMLNKEYSMDLRHFRSKSKSWNGFEKRKCLRF